MHFNATINMDNRDIHSITKDLHGKAKLSGEIQLKGRTSSTKVYTIDTDQ